VLTKGKIRFGVQGGRTFNFVESLSKLVFRSFRALSSRQVFVGLLAFDAGLSEVFVWASSFHSLLGSPNKHPLRCLAFAFSRVFDHLVNNLFHVLNL
jgi:hypothetical protein